VLVTADCGFIVDLMTIFTGREASGRVADAVERGVPIPEA